MTRSSADGSPIEAGRLIAAAGPAAETGWAGRGRTRRADRSRQPARRPSVRTVLSIVLALLSVGIFCYPLVANYLAGRQDSALADSYRGTVSGLPVPARSAARTAAERYNAYLNDARLGLPWVGAVPDYDSTLSLGPDGMMGYLSIPQLNAPSIPIYHGDSQLALSKGIGHMPQSSLPIGGPNTHAVLPAHSGRVNDTLFTDLDKLRKGDVFLVNSLGTTMKYSIFDIRVVAPDDLSSLSIVPGKDIVTLMTCYPTGVNSQRLLVSGQRVGLGVKTAAESIPRNQWGYGFWVLSGLSLVVLIGLAWFGRRLWLGHRNKNACLGEQGVSE